MITGADWILGLSLCIVVTSLGRVVSSKAGFTKFGTGGSWVCDPTLFIPYPAGDWRASETLYSFSRCAHPPPL